LREGERNLQVLQSAKTPDAKRNHLFLKQGMQTPRSMAPLKICCSGWMSTYQIFLTNYGFNLSRSHATLSQETDYVGVSEAVAALALAECHKWWCFVYHKRITGWGENLEDFYG